MYLAHCDLNQNKKDKKDQMILCSIISERFFFTFVYSGHFQNLLIFFPLVGPKPRWRWKHPMRFFSIHPLYYIQQHAGRELGRAQPQIVVIICNGFYGCFVFNWYTTSQDLFSYFSGWLIIGSLWMMSTQEDSSLCHQIQHHKSSPGQSAGNQGKIYDKSHWTCSSHWKTEL